MRLGRGRGAGRGGRRAGGRAGAAAAIGCGHAERRGAAAGAGRRGGAAPPPPPPPAAAAPPCPAREYRGEGPGLAGTARRRRPGAQNGAGPCGRAGPG